MVTAAVRTAGDGLAWSRRISGRVNQLWYQRGTGDRRIATGARSGDGHGGRGGRTAALHDGGIVVAVPDGDTYRDERWFAGDRATESSLRYAARRGGFVWEQASVAPLLSGYATPTLLLHSAEDQMVPLSQSEVLKAQAPTVIELQVDDDGGGHMQFPLRVWERCADICHGSTRGGGARAGIGGYIWRMAPADDPEPLMTTD